MATSVNAKCIENFKKFSELWWSNSGVYRTLLNVNAARIPIIRDQLLNVDAITKENAETATPLKGLSILDAGCGGGYLSESLVKLGATVTGIDPCLDMIEVAKSHAAFDSSLVNLNYQCCTVEEYATREAEKYDVVVTTQVLDYTDDRDLFIESCLKLLKPGGSIFVETKNRSILMWLIMIVFYENITRELPRGTCKYEKFVTPEETKELLENHNCCIINTSGILINVFTTNSTKVPWMNCFYLMHAMKDC